jgi:hypothetical protein
MSTDGSGMAAPQTLHWMCILFVPICGLSCRLAQLDGFRWFSLMRRVDGAGADYSTEGEFGNYISFTIWEDKVTVSCRVCCIAYDAMYACSALCTCACTN